MVRTILLVVLILSLSNTGVNDAARHIESMDYPDLARRAQIQGDVLVVIRTDSNGKVISAVANSGHPILRREAERNIQTWVFFPGSERALQVLYQFKLEKPELDCPRSKSIFDLPEKVTVISNFQTPDHD